MSGSMLLLAFALMLILEGILPFMAPRAWRQMFLRVVSMSDGQIRFFGLTSMLMGMILVLFST
jgi:uncharacterized protein